MFADDIDVMIIQSTVSDSDKLATVTVRFIQFISCDVGDRTFETNASGVVEELYESDQAMSHELLLRKLNSWGKQTLFAVADTAEQMDFMEQDCCQTKLNKIWFGRITTYTKMWQVG